MTARAPLVFRADGLPQQLQSGDTLSGIISTSAPSMDGTASAGSTGKVADAGHVHPTDTSRQAALGYTPNRQCGVLNGSTNGGSFSGTSATNLTSVGFTAVAMSVDAEVKVAVTANSSTANGQVNLYVDVYDTAAGAQKAQGVVVAAYVTSSGYVVIPCGLAYAGLTVGGSYSLRIFAISVNGGQMNVSNASLKGLNL